MILCPLLPYSLSYLEVTSNLRQVGINYLACSVKNISAVFYSFLFPQNFLSSIEVVENKGFQSQYSNCIPTVVFLIKGLYDGHHVLLWTHEILWHTTCLSFSIIEPYLLMDLFIIYTLPTSEKILFKNSGRWILYGLWIFILFLLHCHKIQFVTSQFPNWAILYCGMLQRQKAW